MDGTPTQWTCVCTSFGRWWRTGKPGVLQATGSQRADPTERLNDNKFSAESEPAAFSPLFVEIRNDRRFSPGYTSPRCWIRKEPWSWASQKKVIWRIRTLKWNVSIEVFSLCVDFPSCELPLYWRTLGLERVSRGCVEMACCLRQAQTTRRVWTNPFRKGSISFYRS